SMMTPLPQGISRTTVIVHRPGRKARACFLVPKLCLGTHCREAPLRNPEPLHRPHPLSGAGRDAERRSSAFPSRAWEREGARGGHDGRGLATGWAVLVLIPASPGTP